jgi:hypothetical protein
LFNRFPGLYWEGPAEHVNATTGVSWVLWA